MEQDEPKSRRRQRKCKRRRNRNSENFCQGLCSAVDDLVLSELQLSCNPFVDNKDCFLGLSNQINRFLADEDWSKLKTALDNVHKSQFLDNKEVMEQLSRRIIIPEKQWANLKRGTSDYSEEILRVVEVVVANGTKETMMKCLSEHDGIQVVKKFVLQPHCSTNEKFLCFRIFTKLVMQTKDFEVAKLLIPVALQFKQMLEYKNDTFKVYALGVLFMLMISDCQGEEHLLNEIFKSGLASYAVNVFNKCENVRKQSEKLTKMLLTTWSYLCGTVTTVLMKTSANFDKAHLPTVSKSLLKIISECLDDLNENEVDKLEAVDAAIAFLHRLLPRCNKEELTKISNLGVIKDAANVINIALNKKFKRSECYRMVCNCYSIIYYMMKKEIKPVPNVRVIAHILTPIRESFREETAACPFPKYAEIVAFFCYKAIEIGSKEDVKYLINSGLVSLLAKLQHYLSGTDSLVGLVYSLHDLIVKVPDLTDEFRHFDKEIYVNLYAHYFNKDNFTDEDGIEHKDKESILVYVIVALGISHKCTHEPRFKYLNNFFYQYYKELESGEIPFQIEDCPVAFLMKSMAKLNCFKSSVLPHIWYIAKNGSDQLVKDIFDFLPDPEEPIKVKSQVEMKEQVLKHVLVEVKAVFDRKSEYKTSDLIMLTEFLTTFIGSEQGDLVLFHLEDLVLPCIGLLEDQDDEVIINNVKKFINNLHYC